MNRTGLGGLDSAFSAPPYDLVPPNISYPIYYAPRPQILSWISDRDLSLLVPVVVYWAVSLIFHLLDISEIPWLEKHRIHEPEEIKKRNKVSVQTVVLAVICQHVIQTLLGLYWIDEQEAISEALQDHRVGLTRYAYWISRMAFLVFGPKLGNQALRAGGAQVVNWMYWWGVPIFQFFFASFLLDTWQYFFHRLFHVNRFLYRHIHSIHHRLYCPYAFGALYNHPLEGFLFDTLGTAVAHTCSLMTTRQAILLFGITTLKTCDDHCGFSLPWDPCQLLFGNNVAYHDIHHQHFGIKKNYAQPYFTHWDTLLNTRMTAEQVPERVRDRYHAGPIRDVREKQLRAAESKKNL